jgi:methionyl aminopeptidase
MSKHIPYTEEEVNILKEGGKRLAGILELLGNECKEGVTGKQIDAMAEKIVLENGDIPVFKNYKPHGAKLPFPATICISVNDVVAHGIPNETPFKNGDVISLDLGFRHNGLVVDSAITVIVGGAVPLPMGEGSGVGVNKLLLVTKKALEIGIDQCRVGSRVGDVGIAIEKYVVEQGFNVVDVLCGHAVGREIHSDPQIPHADYGRRGEGAIKFQEGMVVAIEPHISTGSGEIYLTSDQWAYKTNDKSITAQFEHTVLISKDGPVVLTKK